MPNLVAYDLAGVQPMNGPTGLIFAMRSRYTNQSGTEALFDEADTAFSGVGTTEFIPPLMLPVPTVLPMVSVQELKQVTTLVFSTPNDASDLQRWSRYGYR